MARKKTTETKRPIESYEHKEKQRINNPPVGLVTPDTDPDAGAKKKYAYDPHLDPKLQWAGKAEHTSFEVPTISLHVHERIDPCTIVEAVRKKNGSGSAQLSIFENERKEPLREAIANPMNNEDCEFAETLWSDALLSAGPTPRWGGVRFGNRLIDSHSVRLATLCLRRSLPFNHWRRHRLALRRLALENSWLVGFARGRGRHATRPTRQRATENGRHTGLLSCGGIRTTTKTASGSGDEVARPSLAGV